jgi:hypothetical protein
MMVALLALFVALTGGAYAAAKIGAADIANNAVRSKHIKAKEVKMSDLAPVRKFRRKTGTASEQTVLKLAGLELRYSCGPSGEIQQPQLSARTTVNNAHIDLGFTTGVDGFGSSFYAQDTDFDVGNVLDLDRGRVFARGTLVYSTPGAAVVTVTYGFYGSSVCFAHAVAVGGK